MAGLSGVGVFWAFSSLLAALAASVGFYMPFWLRGYMGEMPVYFGVFRRCNYPRMNEYGNLVMVEECGRYSTFGDIPSLSWQIGTLTIGVGCGLAMLVSLTAILAVCIQGIVSPTIARVAGILQLCAGLLIGAGVGIYPNGWDSSEVQQACGYTSQPYYMGECTLFWSFYLTAAGAAVTLIGSAMSCHASKRKFGHAPYADM